MKYQIDKENGVVVITLKSNLEGGPETMKLKDDAKAEVEKGERKFVLDMTNAGFVNSTGIGVVVGMFTSIKDAGGEMKVCGVTDRARRAFVVTGVWQLFDACETKDEAVTALAG